MTLNELRTFLARKGVRVGGEMYTHSQLGDIFKEFEGELADRAGAGGAARRREQVLKEKLREVEEMKTTNQKQGYLKAQMEYLFRERGKVDRRIEHIKAFQEGRPRAKREAEQPGGAAGKLPGVEALQNQTVNRLVGFKGSQHDILSGFVREECPWERR